MVNDSYFDRLDQVVDAVLARVERSKSVLADNDQFIRDLSKPVGYRETNRVDGQLASLKGRPTRKFFHTTIARCESGRYELTAYIL